MLAQHLITRPVFDALFEGYDFAANNPVSRSMQGVLEALDEHRLDKEAESLGRFYASVQRRAQGIDNAEAKQKIVVELYDKFFRNAFPRMTERLGIVYTPVEVVDFIIHSVNEVLQSEFGQTLGSKDVHILDPFTGTGTFITRLLQSGLIAPEELDHKYKNEIHANEIVLLAYYIAAINIEAVYHSQSGGDYAPFEGICLTDTFQMSEKQEDLLSDIFPVNSDRRTRQMELPVKVVVGNPPYSVGQSSENDDSQNMSYPDLDQKIRDTYVKRSQAVLSRNAYDSYIRAMKWASERIGPKGIVAYVSNASWLEASAMDGVRKSVADEFAQIFVFHLRGNQRTSGERSRQEGGKIFGSGSRTPVAITILVKNSDAAEQGQIRFCDIGDYLSQEEKLKKISRIGSLSGISELGAWQTIEPDEHGDWLNQRDRSFENHIALGDKRGSEPDVLFESYTQGVNTSRDAWSYNSSADELKKAVERLVKTYNQDLKKFEMQGCPDEFEFEDETTKISWSRSLKADLRRQKPLASDCGEYRTAIYRPFGKQRMFYSRRLNEVVSKVENFLPNDRTENRAISIVGGGTSRGFSALMIDALPNFHTMDTGQTFPLNWFEKRSASDELDLDRSGRRSCISRDALTRFREAYPGEEISEEDLFYYTYGILHSEDYRTRFDQNLSKELPRIPAVKQVQDFWAFVEAGRQLGDLHCDYESVEPYPVTFEEGALELAHIPDPVKFYRVEKMKFHKVRNKEGKLEPDKSTVIYNSNITMTGIPLEAYNYVVNGKAALDWVMERQCVKTDKKSGIINDANAYANETVGDPAYPLKLFQRVITVSLETMKIVRNLPKLEID